MVFTARKVVFARALAKGLLQHSISAVPSRFRTPNASPYMFNQHAGVQLMTRLTLKVLRHNFPKREIN
jgi:hypothetical protein